MCSFACFCVRPRLERPRLGTAKSPGTFIEKGPSSHGKRASPVSLWLNPKNWPLAPLQRTPSGPLPPPPSPGRPLLGLSTKDRRPPVARPQKPLKKGPFSMKMQRNPLLPRHGDSSPSMGSGEFQCKCCAAADSPPPCPPCCRRAARAAQSTELLEPSVSEKFARGSAFFPDMSQEPSRDCSRKPVQMSFFVILRGSVMGFCS